MIPFKDNIPTRTWPVITVAFIVANCAVFLFQITLPKQAYVDSIYLFGAVPSRLTDLSAWLAPGAHNAAVSVFPSMFMPETCSTSGFSATMSRTRWGT